jgi:hypothetical protein
MKRCLIALTASVLSLTTGVSLAAAATPSLATQTVDQSASSAQGAGAASGAAQTNPSNTNISIRVLSPGNDGSVSQTNSVGSNASASNSNSSDQGSNQSQTAGGTGACCPSGSTGIQSANQSAANAQLAAALSSATQTGASNSNVPVRVLSPGNDGPVSQTNSVDSNASAQNENAATQAVEQEQSAGGTPSASTATCCPAAPSLGVQTIDQQAGNHQAALAGSHATQENPENTNVSVRVLSPGNGGSVSQTNSVDSNASARNSNDADQSANQTQSSGGASTGACCPSGSTGIQIANQGAWNEQGALAGSKAEQSGASNTNVPIRVLSEGNDGGVWQTNSVESDASATNSNSSTQNANQNQSGGSGSGLGIQIAGQESSNAQAALAGSFASQDHAKNSNTPIRVLSPGEGGSVVQTNSVSSGATASNSNNADQSANQTQSAGGSTGACCPSGSTGIQVAGQTAQSEQLAVGLSAAAQEGASNSNSPVRVLSPGNDGGVWQTNSVESDASASNANSSDQSATQNQSSGSGMSACCPSGGLGIQVIGQEAKNHQGAAALSAAFQAGASNENKPLRVLSPGNDGSVVQTNSVASGATATNSNEVDQMADQTQRGGGSSNCHCPSGAIGIQALGQSSWNAQGSLAASFAAQKAGRSPCGCPEGASNVNDPVRVLSPGRGGSVWQANTVESDATGSNTNGVEQSASQTQSGAGAQLGIQAAGQAAQNFQLAAALSAALQIAPKNSSKPLSVLSPGGGGLTAQSNSADSDASGGNRNHATQLARQIAM